MRSLPQAEKVTSRRSQRSVSTAVGGTPGLRKGYTKFVLGRTTQSGHARKRLDCPTRRGRAKSGCLQREFRCDPGTRSPRTLVSGAANLGGTAAPGALFTFAGVSGSGSFCAPFRPACFAACLGLLDRPCSPHRPRGENPAFVPSLSHFLRCRRAVGPAFL